MPEPRPEARPDGGADSSQSPLGQPQDGAGRPASTVAICTGTELPRQGIVGAGANGPSDRGRQRARPARAAAQHSRRDSGFEALPRPP